MVNRLKSYLSSRQLALLYLNEAESAGAPDQKKFNINIVQAVRYLITANNNLQSLAFGIKPKRRKP